VGTGLLRLWVRIPPVAWMSVSCDCQLWGYATGRSLVQRSPTEYGVSNAVLPRNLDKEEAVAHYGCRAIKKSVA